MVFAILKLSYNQAGDSSLTGGLCGTGFLVNSRTGVTAHHCLNSGTLAPNTGFRQALVWGIGRRGWIRPIESDYVSLYPDSDTTIISWPESVRGAEVCHPWIGDIPAGLSVRGIGHVGNAMPAVNAEWQGQDLVILSANIASFTRDEIGSVTRILTMNINADDIKMRGVRGFELSFGSRVGMSGGPVVDDSTGRLVGMLSLGLPVDSEVKTRTFAVSIEEIMENNV